MKLGNLVKKELKELLTPQAIFSMIFTCVLLIVMGNVMGGAMNEAFNNSEVNFADLDGSDFTADMIAKLPDYGADPKVVSLGSDDYQAEMNRLDIKNLVIIPEGFGEKILNGNEAVSVDCVSLVTGGGITSSMQNISASSLTSSISSYIKDYTETVKMGMNDSEKALIDEPLVTVEYTSANGKTVQVSSDMLIGMLMSQSMIAPFAVFFLILMASQMIMTAISTEKIDKTLETLMSAPVSRLTVLCAKMISAVIVALLFLTIAIGLSISLILGAMATDTKSVQTLIMPVMMVTMIPFFVTLFADVNSLSPVFKGIMYIIPFTHTYTAMTNLMFGHTPLVVGGLIYQAVFFAVCMYLAVKMFTSDLLFTMNFSADSGRKKRFAGKKA